MIDLYTVKATTYPSANPVAYNISDIYAYISDVLASLHLDIQLDRIVGRYQLKLQHILLSKGYIADYLKKAQGNRH